MVAAKCVICVSKLFHRHLFFNHESQRPFKKVFYDIMLKRSFSEKGTPTSGKKNDIVVCDEKLGYGAKKRKEVKAFTLSPAPVNRPAVSTAGPTEVANAAKSAVGSPRVLTRQSLLGNRMASNSSTGRGSSQRMSDKSKPKINSSNSLFSKLRNKPSKGTKSSSVKATSAKSSKAKSGNVPAEPVPSIGRTKLYQQLDSPIKSSKDVKEYKIIKLCNGLKAILISDIRYPREVYQCDDDSSDDDSASSMSNSTATSDGNSDSEFEEDMKPVDVDPEDRERETKPHRQMEEKLAAVGLTVGVGSFSDPEDVPGLAHFLEHMVFMGSKKHPKENDFDSFIKRHGGMDNAYTSFETTTFYFECQDKHLWKGMDKFAQFFTDPLLKKEAMTREREAIEAEFQESKSSDSDRIVQLMAGLAKQGHPAAKFTWGNSVSLQEKVSDDRLHAALHAFRERHYSGHRMTLAVEARLPMADLESLVSGRFSSIPDNGLPADDFSGFSGTFDTPAFNRVYRVLSVKDRIQVMLTWAFPSFLSDYRNKPYEYFECLFDHEGRGSLLGYLRKKLWALDISSGQTESGYDDNSMFFLFTVTIHLTDEGYRHLKEVVTAVFGYIAMLRRDGPSERFYEELRSMSEANFTYADETPPSDNVEQLSEALQYFEPRDVLAASYLLYQFNGQSISDFQDGMTPERVNIVVASKEEGIDYDQEEPWFKTSYSVSDIPRDWMEAWKTVAPGDEFHIPEPNVYIPTDLSLLPMDEGETPEEFPISIEATDLREVWYKRDTKFNLPIAYYVLYLISPLPSKSPFNAALLDIYCSMLEYNLATDLYSARLGSITYSISPADHGIRIKVGGFNEKLPLVVQTIAEHMAAFTEHFNEEMFNSVKEERAKIYYNRFINPDKLNTELRLHLLLQRYRSTVEKHCAVPAASRQALLDFVRDYHAALYVKALVQGNVTRHQALGACQALSEQLRSSAIPSGEYPEFRVSELPVGGRRLRVASFNHEDLNSVATDYYQLGLGTIRNCVILELILNMLEEPLFDTLRTKEQLGYSVDCFMKDTNGVIGFTVTVNYQEGKFSVDHVQERIETFLQGFLKTFSKLKPKTFEEARSTLIKLKMCTDVHLREECGRHWTEVVSTAYLFNRLFKEVECLNTVTLKEVRAWVEEHLISPDHLRKLSIQVVGNPSPTKRDVGKRQASSEESRKPGKHKLFNTQSVHPDASECPCLVCPRQTSCREPQPRFSLRVVPSSPKHDVAIGDIEEFRSQLALYPTHRILD